MRKSTQGSHVLGAVRGGLSVITFKERRDRKQLPFPQNELTIVEFKQSK